MIRRVENLPGAIKGCTDRLKKVNLLAPAQSFLGVTTSVSMAYGLGNVALKAINHQPDISALAWLVMIVDVPALVVPSLVLTESRKPETVVGRISRAVNLAELAVATGGSTLWKYSFATGNPAFMGTGVLTEMAAGFTAAAHSMIHRKIQDLTIKPATNNSRSI